MENWSRLRPTSTAVGIAALANPAYLLEVELVAARLPEKRERTP